MITDDRLMSNYLNGSVSAIEELYRRHRRRVFEMAMEHTGDQPHSEQIVQLVFRRLHKSRRKYIERYSIVQHLFVLTRYEIIQYLKRARRFKLEEWKEEVNVTAPTTGEFDGEFKEQVKTQLAALTPNAMEALTVRFQDGLAFAEIADKFDIIWEVS
jgi:RNA polymerase sigma factor (sigma-70 family)